MELRSNLALLTTGTLLNIVSQLLVSSKGFADKSTHILPWVKYTATFLPAAGSRVNSLLKGSQASQRRITQKQKLQLTVIGLLDVMAYGLFSLAYHSCGAALSNIVLSASGQVLTALSTRLILKRRLNLGQWTGISLILTGLAYRALPVADSGSKVAAALEPEQWKGLIMIFGASCLYTALGLIYESLMKSSAEPPPQNEIMWHISKLGFLLSTAYQLLYTRTRFDSLVRQHMQANSVTFCELVHLLVAFGGLFNLHLIAQSLVFKSDGAIGVGVVNSVRGAVLAVVTSLLFCDPAQPWLCLTRQSAISAAVTTLGGLVWMLSDARAKKGAAAAAAAAGALAVGTAAEKVKAGEQKSKDD